MMNYVSSYLQIRRSFSLPLLSLPGRELCSPGKFSSIRLPSAAGICGMGNKAVLRTRGAGSDGQPKACPARGLA